MRKRVPTPLGSLVLSIVMVFALLNHISCGSASAAPKNKPSVLPNATLGLPYSYTIPPGNAYWKLVSGSMPPGLSLAGSVLSGKPSATGKFSFTAQNRSSQSSFSISVLAANQLSITTTSLEAATVGTAYSETLAATGGTPPYSWMVSGGTFAPGLSITVSTGVISGTPTAAGTYNFTVRAEDSSSPAQSATQNLSIVVASGTQPLTITTTSVPSGTVGTAYSAALTATGGTTPYRWSVASGQLPAGITLTSAGSLGGTPTTAQTANFAVQVEDSEGTPQTANQSFALTINSGGTASFDPYGGWQQSTCNAGSTGHWYTEKANSRWWFCTPAGNHFFFEGVGAWVVPGDSSGIKWGPDVSTKYGGSLNTAAVGVINKFTSGFNFNAVGELSPGSYIYPWGTSCAGCKSLPGIQTINVSAYATANLNGYASGPTKNFMWGENGYFSAYRGAGCIDVFDSNYVNFSNQWLANDGGLAAMKNSNYAIGIMVDDTDFVCGMGATPDFDTTPSGRHKAHLGYITLTTSPVQTYSNFTYSATPEVYSDTKIYTKTAMPSPPATCGMATPCSLRDFLANKYGSIGALNTAWGSNYTTFDSTGTTWSFTCGTGDGTTTVFNCTLPSVPISPLSVSVLTGGSLQGGDCPWFDSACNIGGSAPPYTCTAAGQCQGNLVGGSASTIQTGIQPWVQDTQMTAADCGGCGLPQGSYWFRMTWHGCPTTSSREIGSTYTSGSPRVTITAYNGTTAPACATGVDIYVSCRVASGSGTHGCVSASSAQPAESLQASNMPFPSGSWVEPITGLVNGSPLPFPPSSVDYGTGTVQLTFATPPASGQAVTVGYIQGGWMFGSGLMDEDGRNTAWVGTNPYCLTSRAGATPGNTSYACDGVIQPTANANQTLAADLDAWQAQYAGRYFSTQKTALKAAAPYLLYLGADTLGDWDAPARRQILAGAAPYVDVLFWLWFGNQPNSTVAQSKYVYASQYVGDKPMLNFLTLSAAPDSAAAGSTAYQCCFYNTSQAARAQQYYTIVNNELTELSANNSNQWVGQVWWGSHDFNGSEVNNWGLCTPSDNCYDGIEPSAAPLACSAPTQTFSCGNEPAPGGNASLPFGNLIGGSTGVSAANTLWWNQ